LLLGVLGPLTACQTVKSVVGDKDVEYRSTTTVDTLEVPPDLTSGGIDDTMVVPDAGGTGTATYSAYQSDRGAPQASQAATGILPTPQSVRIERAGTQRWLVVNGTPQQVWHKVREFWLRNGMLIDKENPVAGVMETNWAENRANVSSGPIQKYLGKWLGSLYSTGTRDRFRVRLEPGQEANTTEIYLSHRGMVEKVSDIGGGGGEPVTTMWEPRDPDPDLEAEMLRMLMVHLGVSEQRATTLAKTAYEQPAAERATLSTAAEGHSVLSMSDDFERAWRRVGLSLDRVGFTVEDRDRSAGIYYVRYVDPDEGIKKKGFLSRMFGGDKELTNIEYRVVLEKADAGTNVVVRDKSGAYDSSKTAKRILSLLHEQLK
jgi:outer membrane protein assembly factor BamC